MSDHLTERERDIVRGIASGLTNKQIAQAIHVSNHTVKFHVRNAMRKLGAQTRSHVVMLALSIGVLTAPVSGKEDGYRG